MDELKTNPICYLFGHTAGGNDSGFNVCGRCGLHSYWNADEYSQLLLMRVLHARHVAGIDRLLWNIQRFLRRSRNNNLPF